ncbi:F5/8 type C domain-containing protein OS=Streptomyces microflavus OX=1919 GN=Smic_24730 PE=4 SV=1 [Streptomyces microflavus]
MDLLQSQAGGDGAGAWRAQLALESLREEIAAGKAAVGKGVLDPFLDRAEKAADGWNGVDRTGGRVTKDTHSYTVRLERARPVEAVTALAEPASDLTGAVVEAHVPGEGWRALGQLSPTGWTQTAAKGLRADAVRVTVPEAARTAPPSYLSPSLPPAPAVPAGTPKLRALVPWFGDEPDAVLDLAHGETDAEIGGGPKRVAARLAGRRPAEVKGALTAKAPKGIEVRVPKQTTVPRGPTRCRGITRRTAGEYEVPLTFGGQMAAPDRAGLPAYGRPGGASARPRFRPRDPGRTSRRLPPGASRGRGHETRWPPVEVGEVGRASRAGAAGAGGVSEARDADRLPHPGLAAAGRRGGPRDGGPGRARGGSPRSPGAGRRTSPGRSGSGRWRCG